MKLWACTQMHTFLSLNTDFASLGMIGSFPLHLIPTLFWFSCWLGYPGKQVACIMFTDCFFGVQQVAEYLIFAMWKFLFLFTSHTNIIDILAALWFFLEVWCIILMSTFLVKCICE